MEHRETKQIAAIKKIKQHFHRRSNHPTGDLIIPQPIMSSTTSLTSHASQFSAVDKVTSDKPDEVPGEFGEPASRPELGCLSFRFRQQCKPCLFAGDGGQPPVFFFRNLLSRPRPQPCSRHSRASVLFSALVDFVPLLFPPLCARRAHATSPRHRNGLHRALCVAQQRVSPNQSTLLQLVTTKAVS